MIPDGATCGIGGFIGSGHPQEFSVGIEESFLKSGHPNNLTIMFSAGIGDGTDKLGLNKLGHEGLLKKNYRWTLGIDSCIAETCI